MIGFALDARWTVPLMADGMSRWAYAVDAVDADLVARDPVGLIAASRSDDQAPLALLPYLAAERSVNEFDGAWPEARKRAVTRGSFAFHQAQGTRPALDRALTPLGYAVKAIEWFERELREPYTFRIRVDLQAEPWTARKRSEVIRVANAAKSAHTKLEALEYSRAAGPATLFVGGLVVRRRLLRIREVAVNIAVRVQGAVFLGTTLNSRRTLRIHPRP